jgi:hypothetical protein
VLYAEAEVAGMLQANMQAANAEVRAASTQALTQIAEARETALLPSGHAETPVE